MYVAKGKSTVVLEFRGKNAKKARQLLEMVESIPIQASEGQEVQLNYDTQTMHVGSKFLTGTNVFSEVQAKAKKICISELRHVLGVLRDPGCSDEARYTVARAYVISKALTARLTASGTWPVLTAAEAAPLDARINKVYRACVADIGKDTKHTNAFVRSAHGFPETQDILAAEALSLYCRVLHKATPELKLVLAAAHHNKTTRGPRDWLGAIK